MHQLNYLFLAILCVECLHAFQKTNHDLPDRIIMYRDGVGDGQLKYVYETELMKIQVAPVSTHSKISELYM